ncbi:2248_t:CDS:2, partial [Cetraspora pellucida]
DHLTIFNYIYDKDNEVTESLTDNEILKIVKSKNREKEEKERDPIKIKLEFGEVEEKVKALRKLHKRVRLNIVKNLKQTDLNYFLNTE